MKRVYTLVLAVLFIASSGCTFFTEVDADVNTGPDGEDSSSCDSLFIMLEAERDPDMRAELAAAYARCIEGNEDGDNNSNPPPCDGQVDGDCQPNPRPCEDGQVSEDGRCNPDPRPCDETDADCHPNDPPPSDECRIIEENSDVIEQMTDEDLVDACEQFGLDYETCINLIRQCLGDDGGEDGDNGGDEGEDGDDSTAPTCQDAYDALEQFGADPKDLSQDEAFDVCVQHGAILGFGQLTDRQCRRLSRTCFPVNNDDNSEPAYCTTVVELVENEGYTVPLDDQTADHLFNECVQNLGDVQRCEAFRQCVI